MLVVRGPFSVCSYVGVHADHALASLEELEFDRHFGINFRNWGQPGTLWEETWFWWGWAYAHFMAAIPWEASLPNDANTDERQILARLRSKFHGTDFFGNRPKNRKIGRASCRERACKYVYIT